MSLTYMYQEWTYTGLQALLLQVHRGLTQHLRLSTKGGESYGLATTYSRLSFHQH